MPSTRRDAFRAAGLGIAALAGCLNPTGTEQTTNSSTGNDSDSTTGTPLPDETVELPEGPKSAPSRPNELSLESVKEYAKTFERRYTYNDVGAGGEGDWSFDCDVLNAEKTSESYQITVHCTGQQHLETVTPAPYIGDKILYQVDSNSTIRKNKGDV